MSNYLQALQVRYGEIINKIYRVYGRFKLYYDLDKLPPLKSNTSCRSALDSSKNKTICLILGTERTSSQFLFSAYLWQKHLQNTDITIKLVSDGTLSQNVIDKAKKLLGDSTEIINAQNILQYEDMANDYDTKFKKFCQSHKFGRKFLAIYSFSQHYNVIYSDDDI